MPPSALFFSFEGRINRLPFWIASLAAVFVLAFLIVLSLALGGPSEETATVIFILAIPGVWIALALGAKRLHDRDKSAWWLLVFYVLPSALEEIGKDTGRAGIILILIALVLSLWALVELGFRRGTNGPNRYGADPLNRTI